MQVFIIGSVLETAAALDSRRFNKQIIETKQILSTLSGLSGAWKNHPCILQYKKFSSYLFSYVSCLIAFREGDVGMAKMYSDIANRLRPEFHTKEYFDQMKRRLYTKDPEHYSIWSYLGESDENWYYVNSSWVKYKNGKKI